MPKSHIAWNKGKSYDAFGKERFSVGQKRLFHWIKDKKIYNLITRDFVVANLCLKYELNKPAIILYSGVLEAIFGYALKRSDLSFAQLIEQAFSNKLITESNRNKLNVIRDFRNYIHLLLESKGEFELNPGISQLAKQTCESVINELKGKLK